MPLVSNFGSLNLINPVILLLSERKSGLDGFKDLVRWMATSYSPWITWTNVLAAGLECKKVIEKRMFGKVPKNKAKKDELYMLYDVLVAKIPDAEDYLRKVVQEKHLGRLVSQMSTSSSDLVTQDATKIKDVLLEWLPNVLGFAWNVRNGTLDGGHITGRLFPSVLYQDLDKEASQAHENVFSCLLGNWVLVLTWVWIYLGGDTAKQYYALMKDHRNSEGQISIVSFKPNQVGKAWAHGLIEPTVRTISYACHILLHSLSATNNRRVNEGNVTKRDTFESIVALDENSLLHIDDFIDSLLDEWTFLVGFLLDEDDKYSSFAHILAFKTQQEKVAAAEAAKMAAVADADVQNHATRSMPSPSRSSDAASDPPTSSAPASPSPLRQVTNTTSNKIQHRSSYQQPSAQDSPPRPMITAYESYLISNMQPLRRFV
ncbi:hypothetical protein BDP27DRAFT_1423732 [Rhodocollybia butyracea]|uniref:Uncharacterized protein n=1 Tax=Rhodocollybia butyracea TaxID=206335 RepID=A0A9P5U4B5_9AGAR|nr:hypothetical protein BDP27DRAFT_1423732 [Rhodocollybia butyracea]